MAINSTESKHKLLEGQVVGAGPFLARVVNHLDSTLMGGLEVLLYEGGTADSNLQSNTIPVYYMSPFWGTTSSGFEGNNSADFNDVQKSYGMWMVPPDIGSCVMVIFVRGMANAGYWIGCIPDTYQNHMVPGIAASRNVALTPEQERKYGTTNLPVGEFLKRSRDLSGADVNKFTKPVHPFADRLLAQGLILDDIRGITSSSARREYPSSVFGISTPGPIDESKGSKTGEIGFDVKSTAYVSRMGGSQFVMDDGDKDNLNELIRIRTRTGHQILLHNSSDLIYIGNAAGTAWIELTSQGKIDAYAADSISLHAEGDFNLRADRDFNIEAGRAVKITSGENLQIESGNSIYGLAVNDIKMQTSKELHISAGSDMFLGAQSDMHISASGDNLNLASGGNTNIKVNGDFRLGSTNSFIQATDNLNINGGQTVKLGSQGSVSFNANDTISIAATKKINVLGKQALYLTSPALGINGPAATAGPAPDSATADAPTFPDAPEPLQRYNLPNRQPPGSWSDGEFYKAADIVTIMTRVPTHEPWEHHENVNPERFGFGGTDSENTGTNTFSGANIVYNKNPSYAPPSKTGNLAEDNIAAFLWTIRRAEGTASKDGYRTQYTSALFDIDNAGLPPGVTTPTGAGNYNGLKFYTYGSNSYDKNGDSYTNRSYKYKDHPRIVLGPARLRSSAAGAYQFMPDTWDTCKKACNLPDFSPASQDKACIYLLQTRNALDDVRAGKFSSAAYKIRKIWASFQGAGYGQREVPTTTLAQYFREGGGTLVA